MIHYIYSGFGISADSYGSKTNLIGGTGQVNSFLGEACKAKSCRIISTIEEKELGLIVKLLITNTCKQWSAIAFVDNTSFFGKGSNVNEKVQQILNIYTRYYEAIGGLVE